MGKELKPIKKYLTDISPKAWEHPADRAALLATGCKREAGAVYHAESKVECNGLGSG